MHVIKTDFNGNINLGLYAFATDKYCLVGPDVPKDIQKKLEEILKVPVHEITIAGTGLVGVFLSGNERCLLIPKIAFDTEIEAIKKIGIPYYIIDTKLTALGNNILCNSHGCLINPDFGAKEEAQIKDALKIPVKRAKIAGLSTVGSLAAFNKKGCLLHRDAEDFEIDMVESTLGVNVSVGTVNFGSPYIKSGMIANTHGFMIGSLSGGPEIQNADRALGFISD